MAQSALTRSFLKRYIPLFVLNALAILAIVGISQYVLVKYFDQDKMQVAMNEFGEMQRLYGEQALGIARTLAHNPDVIQAFQMPASDQQRAILDAQSKGIFQSLKKKYSHPIVVFIKPDQVLFRAPNPKFFGDKPIKRPHMIHVIQSGEAGAALETLKVGFAMNGVAPVISAAPEGNTVLGVAQVSLPISELYKKVRDDIPGSQIAVLIDTQKIGKLKKLIKGEHLGNYILADASTPGLAAFLRTHSNVMKEGYEGYARVDNQIYRLIVRKIPGYGGSSVGLLVFSYDVSSIVRYTLIAVGASLLFVILSFLIIGWVLERFVEHKIISPVTALAGRVRDISMGKQLERAINQTENNEIGTIQSSAERLRKTLLNMLKHVQR